MKLTLTFLSFIMVAVISFAEMPGESVYYEATIDFENHRYADAEAKFESVAEAGGALIMYARVRQGDALAALNNHKRAETIYREVIHDALPGPWTRLAAARLAIMLDGDGRYSEARVYFDRSVNVPMHPWWLYKMEDASARNAIHIPDRAAEGFEYFTEIYRTSIYPAQRKPAAQMLAQSPFADDKLLAIVGLSREGEEDAAIALLKSMTAQSQGDPAMLSHLAYINGALHLVGDGSVPQAFDVADPPDAMWARWCLVSRMSHHGTRQDWAICEQIADTMIRVWPGTHETIEGVWRHAYWLREHEQYAAAADVFLRTAKLNPLHRRSDDGYANAAALYLEANMKAQAIGAFEQLTEAHPHTRAASEAHWRLIDLLAGDPNMAGMVAALERGALGSVGHYYTHRIIARAEDKSARGSLPRSIDNLIGYKPMTAEMPRPIPIEIKNDPIYKRMEFFGRTGLIEGEWEALDFMESTMDDSWRPWRFRILTDTGHVHTATEYCEHENFGTANGEPTIERLRIYYARPHWDHVQALARETGVDPYLILAVGRQESTFRPALTSYAGASGLMQLMPTTAQWMVSAEPGISADDVIRLEDPTRSLRLGAYYLKRMLGRWDGGFVHALASYNAGPGNAIKWDKRFDSSDLGEWIEQIPYEETKDYVKRVLGNYAAYRSLYPEAPATGQ